jgi:thiol-disulfide isomerase/thioredoxin
MKFLIIFIYIITCGFSFAVDKPNIKNLIIVKNQKNYKEVTFRDKNQKIVDLYDYKGKLVLLNFWATWCTPCKEEMPSLDRLKKDVRLDNLEIFPINIGQESLSKSKKFFKELEINNLNIYYDSGVELAKKFMLRGVPTTVLFNKEGKEFARIIGSIDFSDKAFIDWLKLYN